MTPSGTVTDNGLIHVEGLWLSLPDPSRQRLFRTGTRINILKGLDFAINRGEVLGIVGSSGSGKSTLGRALVKLLEPTAGRILFDGVDFRSLGGIELRDRRRSFQMIFQDPMSSLNPRRRVGAIIESPLRLHRFTRIAERCDEAMAQVGLSMSLRDRYPHELSGGQRQRVGIARAIALGPDFVVADEIVSGLDMSTQAQVLNLLQQLVAQLNLTLAFISHDLAVVRKLCDRVMVIEDGRIVEIAPTAQLFSEPASECARNLLDAIPLPDPDQPNWLFGD